MLSFCLPPLLLLLLLLLLLYLSASYLLLPTILFASAPPSSSTNLQSLLSPTLPLTRLASALPSPSRCNTGPLTLSSQPPSPLSFVPANPPPRLKLYREIACENKHSEHLSRLKYAPTFNTVRAKMVQDKHGSLVITGYSAFRPLPPLAPWAPAPVP